MISFDRVVQKYPTSQSALKDISFKILEGEFVTMIGHSGAGKSTVFKLILGEEYSTSGSVSFFDQDIAEMDDDELIEHRRKIGVIFQDFRLLPSRTVYENIAFAMEAIGFSDKQIKHDVPYVLDLVGLKSKIWNFPNELSGGEKQRISMARAIINEPKLLLADEPTGNLDDQNAADILNLIKQIHKLGTTIILATHNKNILDSIDTRTIKLSCGKIISDK